MVILVSRLRCCIFGHKWCPDKPIRIRGNELLRPVRKCCHCERAESIFIPGTLDWSEIPKEFIDNQEES